MKTINTGRAIKHIASLKERLFKRPLFNHLSRHQQMLLVVAGTAVLGTVALLLDFSRNPILKDLPSPCTI